MLGSGSAGNCAVVESGQCRLLIDGGLSARQITRRLEGIGIHPIGIDGILLTHEHGDHVRGLEVLCRQFAIPIYCNRLTAEAIRGAGLTTPCDWRLFSTGSDFPVKDITVQTFAVPHDAVDPIGFVLSHGGASLGFATDLGFATKLLFERLRAVQTLVIETNHDEKMLQDDTRRPWPVKQRIMSRHGHLSNAAAAQVVSELLETRLQRVVLGHLSRDCNRPELALGAVRSRIAQLGGEVDVLCASQNVASGRIGIGAFAGRIDGLLE